MGIAKTDEDVEMVWSEVWLPLVAAPDGTVDMMQVKRELSDYRVAIGEVGKVYRELTGSQFSKPNTAAHYVIEAAEQHFKRMNAPDRDDAQIEFEAWVESVPAWKLDLRTRESGDYYHENTVLAWSAWCASMGIDLKAM